PASNEYGASPRRIFSTGVGVIKMTRHKSDDADPVLGCS
ncbi:unnamed protein product, partial [marine sediment metagenome]